MVNTLLGMDLNNIVSRIDTLKPTRKAVDLDILVLEEETSSHKGSADMQPLGPSSVEAKDSIKAKLK